MTLSDLCAKTGFILQLVAFLWSGQVICSTKENVEPKIYIKSSKQSRVFTRTDLLARPDVTQIESDHSPAYPTQKLIFTAIPVAKLFQGIELLKDATIEFHCLDGFSALLSKDRLLNASPEKSVAYLAIEKETEKWPALDPSKNPATAGPFYLIWLNPNASKIGREEWPFQLTGFEIKESIEHTYPLVVPNRKLSNKNPIQIGFQVFVKNCFTCHTMNLQGSSKVGPDLNVPMNPTEYFKPNALRRFIRDPQNVRRWPSLKMPPFPETVVSEPELDNLIHYLSYMVKRE